MKLTWADIEPYRNRVSPLQWNRLQAYFREGKTLMQLSAAEYDGQQLKKAKSSLNLSLGRACIAILKAMLEESTKLPETADTQNSGRRECENTQNQATLDSLSPETDAGNVSIDAKPLS